VDAEADTVTPAATTPTISRRTARVLRGVLGALFVVSFLLFVVLLTLRYTVLDAPWYREVLAETNTYERVYDRVLVDPEVKSVTDDLVGNLPIDRALIDANLRLVIPPDTLADTLDRTITTLTEYLRKDRNDVDADFAIGPMQRNLERLNRAYLDDLVSTLEPRVVSGLEEFSTRFEALEADVNAGRTPTEFPALPPIPGTEDTITDVLVGDIADPPPELRDQVRFAVGAGDVNTAFALVIPHLRDDEASAAAADLRRGAGGEEYDYGSTIVIAEDGPEMNTVRTIRDVAGDLLPFLMVLSIVLMTAALLGIGYVARASGGRVPRTIATTVVVGGVVVNVVWLIARWFIGDPLSGLTSRDSGLPSALRSLLGDIGDSAFGSFDDAILGMGQLAIIVGGTTLLGLWLVPKAVALVRAQPNRRLLRVGSFVVGVIVVVAAFAVLRPGPVEAEGIACNGHAELCDRRVDQVVFPMAHNAMSSSQRGWISANHDLAFPAQLDQGIRGLMLDWWDWEEPDRLLEFAETETIPQQYADLLRNIVMTANPTRPGTWMCHGFCKLGHERLAKGLGEVKAWLDDNPDEVLVVIAEDHISAAKGEAAMRASGLAKYAYVPPKDPDARWPTLRTLIQRDRRLVFFTEKHSGDAPWYRKGYDYMMETPYTFSSPDAMSCAPKRGGTGKRLFLMNHWIQKAAPSRSDAGQVNAERFIVRRARECERERGQLPNFVAVDFASIGDVVAATERLNGVPESPRR
jgi:hypothetical protein